MATDIPNTEAEIDAEILWKKSDSAGYSEPQGGDETAVDEAYRYWPSTRMSIIEGLQDEAIDQKVWERFVDLYGPLIFVPSVANALRSRMRPKLRRRCSGECFAT